MGHHRTKQEKITAFARREEQLAYSLDAVQENSSKLSIATVHPERTKTSQLSKLVQPDHLKKDLIRTLSSVILIILLLTGIWLGLR